MAAENGYVNEPSYGLYDTTGSTEDWAYYATGSLGYTFEIGATNFHPPYADTVAEWNGTSALAKGGGGNREAYYHIAEYALNRQSHARIRRRWAKRGQVVLTKSFETPTSPVLDANGVPGEVQTFQDNLRSAVRVRRNGHFTFNINPSTRPLVAQASGRDATGPPSDPIQFTGDATTATPCADAESEGSDLLERLPADDSRRSVARQRLRRDPRRMDDAGL